MELARILNRHPNVSSLHLFSSPDPNSSGTSATTPGGKSKSSAPALAWEAKAPTQPFDEGALKNSGVDVVFFATPNEASHEIIPRFQEAPFRIIDLSGSFRLKQPALYPQWYGFAHACPDLLSAFVYGLPELHKTDIAEAKRVANPGCYATSALLPLLPLIGQRLIDETAAIICDSKSGVSGAGKQPSSNTHFCEVSESFKAYSVFSHRHAPEIEQSLGLNGHHQFLFTPHLLPINRGILSTLYVRLKERLSEDALRDLFVAHYADAPFVRIFPKGEFPQVKWVAHTNYCDIGMKIDPNSSWIILISCLDNLVKGAAGQAVQNMNLMFGLNETAGLE